MTEHQPELLSNENQSLSPEEQARRDAARKRLAELLKDPQFRAIEGFPIGEEEDILALSDPPYYTACPNPFLPEIIAEWQQDREALRKKLKLSNQSYQREPFAADVSEGKNDPIYNAHSYHTKVPHKAIMRYILHYTDPGDIIFDGFCGTGMTGVAAQLCGDKKAVEELGYRVDTNGLVWDGEKVISHIGTRKAVLNDLSPAATYISYHYNSPSDISQFEKDARLLLSEAEKLFGWMYETQVGSAKRRILYTVWSDIVSCPECGLEHSYWDLVVDLEKNEVVKEFRCPNCSVSLTRRNLDKVWVTEVKDGLLTKQVKRSPVLILFESGKGRLEKMPETSDISLIERVNQQSINYWFPLDDIPEGDKSSDPYNAGITKASQYFTKRSLLVVSFMIEAAKRYRSTGALTFWLTSGFDRLSLRNGYRPQHRNNKSRELGGPLPGNLYIPPFSVELNPFIQLKQRLNSISRMFLEINHVSRNAINTSSTTEIFAPENVIDYVFVDPPFGSNLMYSELNFSIEAWLKVRTNNKPEAIINRSQRKSFTDYTQLMENSFKQMYRLLKPGRWITVEFHNSQNSVWNSIQEALARVGFVVADVRSLERNLGTLNQINYSNAVKQDLIISAYKPNGNLEKTFGVNAGTEAGVWEFIRYHLGKVPVVNVQDSNIAVNAERKGFLLFDRMIAFHIQRGVMVPISAPEFYAGLEQRFPRRDGMYFLPEQVNEYDRAVLDSKGVVQLSLFVTDEKTAIQWLRMQLDPSSGGQPQTHADLNPKFKLALHQAKHEKAPELIEILEQNFLQDEEGEWFVPDHNRASDLERVRLRGLLREFNEYAVSAGRLRQFRTEAVRAGFADAYKRQEYETIIKVASRLPEDVLREDPDLLMYYDSAMLRKR